MTSLELQNKLNDAQAKVEKRIETIKKVCKKLNVNADELLASYHNFKSSREDFLLSNEARAIVSQYAKSIERDYSRDYTDEEYWSMCDWNEKVSQLEDNLKKLFDLERVARNWQVKYDIQLNKENTPKIKVLWDFLTNWENQARNWYVEDGKHLVKVMNDFQQVSYKYLVDNNYFNLSYEEKRNFVVKFNEYFEELTRSKRRHSFSHYSENDYVNVKNIDAFTRLLTHTRFIASEDNYRYDQNVGYSAVEGEWIISSFDEECLNKTLAQEKQAKYEDLCNRISAVVGEITDCKNLSIGNQNGELNGTVIGTKGTARVETIGAGGYNIQCFHYRVLVHKLA